MAQRFYQINSNANDAYEINGGITYLNGTLYFFYGTSPFNWYRYHFLRFTNIDIPQGSTISTAYLHLLGYSQGSYTTPADLTVYAENQDNASWIKTQNAGEISNREKTTNSVTWNPAAAWNLLEAIQSPSLHALIQEVVNRPGWVAGNAINILIDVENTGGDPSLNRACSYEIGEAYAPKLEINFNAPSGSITQITQPKTKQFYHKIYDGSTYKATWAKEVYNIPEFRWNINGGLGEMVIDLKRDVKSYGENVDVKMGNKIETWVQDGDQELGKLVWQGVLNRYEPIVLSDGTQGVRVRGVSKLIEMKNRIVRDGDDNTEVVKSSKDPSTILKEIIDSASAGSTLQKGDIDNTDTTVSYTFNADNFVDAFDIVNRLSPQHWFWRLNPDNTIDFQQANYDEVRHQFYVGKHVNNVEMTKTIEKLVNRVYFMGGGSPNLFRKYERTSSQAEFGLRERFVKDERVTAAATAETMSTRLLDEFDHPISEIELVVLDNNIDPVNGYDIESLKPGEIIQVLHPEVEYGFTLWDEATWDIDYWDFDISKAFGNPHQVVEIKYEFNKAIIKASAKLADIQKRIEDINRNLDTTAKVNLPSAPT